MPYRPRPNPNRNRDRVTVALSEEPVLPPDPTVTDTEKTEGKNPHPLIPNLSDPLKVVAWGLFAFFITTSYQSWFTDFYTLKVEKPLCQKYESSTTPATLVIPQHNYGRSIHPGQNHEGAKALDKCSMLDELSTWKWAFLSPICGCTEISQPILFVLRAGISVLLAWGIAFLIHFAMKKFLNEGDVYEDEFEGEVGQEKWRLKTRLVIKRKVKEEAKEGDVEDHSSTEGSDKDKGTDREEVLRFLFKAIQHFGENTDVSQDDPELQALFKTAEVCSALSYMDSNMFRKWPEILAGFTAEMGDKNRNEPQLNQNQVEP